MTKNLNPETGQPYAARDTEFPAAQRLEPGGSVQDWHHLQSVDPVPVKVAESRAKRISLRLSTTRPSTPASNQGRSMADSIAEHVAAMGGNSYGITGVTNRSGTNDPPVAHALPSRQTAGHRAPPPHVQQAHRRQVMIDGVTGQREVFDPSEQNLRSAVAKWQSHASAVNHAIAQSPRDAGSLDAHGTIGVADGSEHLPWIFFGAGV